MKKIIYSLSFVALTGFVATAQSTSSVQPINNAKTMFVSEPQQQEPKKEASKKSKESKKEEITPVAPAENAAPARQTRMAINEKGVPASKETKTTTTTPADKSKGQKTATPGQPASDNK